MIRICILIGIVFYVPLFCFGQSIKDTTQIDTCAFGSVEKDFVGGLNNYFKIVGNHLVYPKKSKEDEVFGKVYFSLMVDTTGNIYDLKIIRGLNEEINDEVLRCIPFSNGHWKIKICDTKKRNYNVAHSFYFELRGASGK